MSKKDHHQIPLRLPVELYKSVESHARERGITTSAYIRDVLTTATRSNGGQEYLLKTLHEIDEHIEWQGSMSQLLFDSQLHIINSLFRNVTGTGSSPDKEETKRRMDSFLKRLDAHLSSATWFSRVLENAHVEGNKSRERERE